MSFFSAQCAVLLNLLLTVPIMAIFPSHGLAATRGHEGVTGAFLESTKSVKALWSSSAASRHNAGQSPTVPFWLLMASFGLVIILSLLAYLLALVHAKGEFADMSKDLACEAQSKSSCGKSDGGAVLEKNQLDEATLQYWVKSSGMHTVQNWCERYNEHPAGWGALLMIHGVQEVTARLRSKVENYALYASLFVAGSIASIVQPPEVLMKCGVNDLRCEVLKRMFMYGLILGLVSHVLCILLAMAFVNALNEAARDADVIRMFARGKGFYATVRCENAFTFGACMNVISIIAVAVTHLGVEVFVVLSVACPIAIAIYVNTSTLLFQNASIVRYWRSTGHADDPYDLTVPLECLKYRAQHASEF